MLDKINLRTKLLTLPFASDNRDIKQMMENLFNSGTSIEFEKSLKRLLNFIVSKEMMIKDIKNIDELALLFKTYYSYAVFFDYTLSGKSIDYFYLERLEDLSKHFITHRNGKIAIKYWESNSVNSASKDLIGPYSGYEKILIWNSFNRTFCTDILVVMYLLSNEIGDVRQLAGYHGQVHLADTQLDQVLSKGVAETHLHGNAGRFFDMQWIDHMNPTKSQSDSLTDDLLDSVYIAAIIRMLIANYLYQLTQKDDTSIYTFYEHVFCGKEGSAGFTVGFNVWEINFKQLIDYILGEELEGLNNISNKKALYWDIRSLFNLHNVSGDKSFDSDDGHIENQKWNQWDCIYSLLDMNGNYCSTEVVFLYRALKHMRNNYKDSVLCKLFWRYIRIKNEMLQYHVQRDFMKGLEYFSKIYDESTPSRLDGAEYWEANLHKLLTNQYIKKIEIRISPKDKEKALANKIIDILIAYKRIINEFQMQSEIAPKLGVVIHFIKRLDNKQQEKCWSKYCQNHCENKFLSQRLNYDIYMKQMKVFRDIREKIPGLSDYLVGIDAASVESYTEPWVFAQVFRSARDSKTHKLVYENDINQRIRNLGFTYHVGEDFRHPISGLRHIDEVIEHFQFHAGDRIGHGIALGLNVKNWVSVNPVVVLPRMEYLENLLWVWGTHKHSTEFIQIDVSNLERKILDCSYEIFGAYGISGEGLNVYKLWNAYRRKFKMFEDALFDKNVKQEQRLLSGYEDLFCQIDSISQPNKQKKINWTEEGILFALHCKPFLIKMEEPIQIKIELHEIEVIGKIQQMMKNRVSNLGIIVETNPTSNAIIGEMDHIFEHHIQNLHQGYTNFQNQHTVMATINSDDPLIFNTNINNEFAYIYYALLHKGYSRENVLNWIDIIRQRGMQSSFIDDRELTNAQLNEEVDTLINELYEHLNY